MEYIDDRNDEQRKTHHWLVIGTDSFLSGWGLAESGTSIAAWAATDADVDKVERWVRDRKDMKRVRVVLDAGKGYRAPRGAAHVHIYVVGPDHRAVS